MTVQSAVCDIRQTKANDETRETINRLRFADIQSLPVIEFRTKRVWKVKSDTGSTQCTGWPGPSPLALICAVPPSVQFCLGWWEIGRSGRAGGQDDGTCQIKVNPTQVLQEKCHPVCFMKQEDNGQKEMCWKWLWIGIDGVCLPLKLLWNCSQVVPGRYTSTVDSNKSQNVPSSWSKTYSTFSDWNVILAVGKNEEKSLVKW